jgi:RNA polymerase sigma-70 factor (ECF subfamily)
VKRTRFAVWSSPVERSLPLADAFVAQWADPAGLSDPERLALQADLEARLAEAAAEHPGLTVDAAQFLGHLGRQVDPGSGSPLTGLHIADAYLAFAGGRGDAVAVTRLRTRFGADVDRALSRALSTGLSADELRQRAWVKLLADGADNAPHIRKYGGRGSLQGWIRVVVSRMAVDLLRSKGGQREQAVAPQLLAEIGRTDPDPQFEMLRDRYRDEVQAAMEDAFSALSDKDRRLLRGHLVERLNIDDLGAMFGVHRTTAARWVHKARSNLLDGAHAALRTRVGAGEQTVRSLVQMVRSQIDLSVGRLLASDAGDD